MKIVCYSSCYGSIIKEKLISPLINIFDCIYWYEREKKTIDFKKYISYNVLICEYITSKPNIYSSDEFIKHIKHINPSIQIITYPLVILKIFPFHKSAFGFLSNSAIDSLINQNIPKQTIINMYKEDKILFNPIQEFVKSLKKLREIEKECDIKLSDFIEENFYKKQICIDTIFPSNDVFNYLCTQIVSKLHLDIKFNHNEINNNVYIFHKRNSVYTKEMKDSLKLGELIVDSNYKQYYFALLLEYLKTKS